MSLIYSLFKSSKPADWKPPTPPKQPKPDCKHLDSYMVAASTFGWAWCPECETEIRLDYVLNNWLDELRRVKSECC